MEEESRGPTEIEIFSPPRKAERGADGKRKKRGPGHPPVLNEESLRRICDSRSLGLSIKEACAAEGVTQTTHGEWVLRGKADKSAGLDSIYARYAVAVPLYDAVGKRFRRKFVRKLARNDQATDMDIKRAALMLRLDTAIETGTLSGKASRKKISPDSATIVPTAPQVELSRLNPEEYSDYQLLAEKMRTPTAFVGMTLKEFQRLQALLAKGMAAEETPANAGGPLVQEERRNDDDSGDGIRID